MLKLLVPKNVLLPASVGAALNLSDTELENGTKLEVNTNAVKFKLSNNSALLAYEAVVAFIAVVATSAKEAKEAVVVNKFVFGLYLNPPSTCTNPGPVVSTNKTLCCMF